jgi:heme d1 biosynthesis radical SAM protein NirJ
MFRLSRYLRELLNACGQQDLPAFAPVLKPPGPVVIWNLIRRCNLTCKHCYATSVDKDFPGELTTEQAITVLNDLRHGSPTLRVPAVILSGGEPLLRHDIFTLAKHAKSLGLHTSLSSNGTLIDASKVAPIVEAGFDYVGISLDGLAETHDRFRRKAGAFAESLTALRLCRNAGLKVGVRFTLTQDNAHDLPPLLQLIADEGIPRFYFSHLNYAGRGNKHRKDDAHHQMTRQAMDLLFETCLKRLQADPASELEFTTGNNDADAVYFLHWAEQRFADAPAALARLRQQLAAWGGNASGLYVANIDNLGNVHPDTMWPSCTLGNVLERPFSTIWQDTSLPLFAALKQQPRPVEGRCARCQHLDTCGGNTRVRALQLTGNPWAEDPGCYLDDHEIGLEAVCA